MSDSDDVDSLGSEEVVVKPKRKKRKKNKDPNRPKRNMSAFFLYSNANRARVKADNPDAKFGDIAKLLSAEFKEIDADEKAEWDAKAEADKQRYLAAMEDYVPPSDDESDSDSDDGAKKKKKKKKKKDPNAPKRNQSAFFLYSNATRADIKAAQPDLAFGEIAKVISVNFKALPSEERAYWDEKAAADKVRYQTEMAAYRGEA
mmetsp:Transcript_14134/g.20058  ORF Transcript_14134/g.20058 Transcript_14134/m.20058 type:complete len:203 (+) Transcript_14134:198-806(+)|eukprot:CAMPEP_0201691626 /NCGR_PEP_ID=MMETSP0578-20130828/4748_1 /ASSEMBLY_ACC=CAM_ASM_000663 /TAXON_ID=267565 /ORGANISM="Skeletonema grethea, Strain CCMP 1804" /LENGTH=202 /DNA_ID=CAMNT_0048176869 /DNA_START=142 /DNA_END=750 /DNA_ORIENTATION=+